MYQMKQSKDDCDEDESHTVSESPEHQERGGYHRRMQQMKQSIQQNQANRANRGYRELEGAGTRRHAYRKPQAAFIDEEHEEDDVDLNIVPLSNYNWSQRVQVLSEAN